MTKKRLSQEDRRTQITEVAISLFAEKGFKGATTRAIAKAAGVSEAIIFRHFSTKEDLYDAIIEHTVEKRLTLWEHEEPPPGSGGDLETQLRAFARSYIRRNRQDPTFIRLMMYSALEDHKFREKFLDIYRSPRIKSIHKAIQEGVEQGRYRPVDPGLTTRSFFWVLVQYCISRFIATTRTVETSKDNAMVDNLVSIFMQGLIMAPEMQANDQNQTG
ncbi:MAG: TetR/AcrR family transcriptional regulator [bacterium]|nr:TetR/AcrR family transcriptional regulator [bacterium]